VCATHGEAAIEKLLVQVIFVGVGAWFIFRGLPRLLFRNPELDWTSVDGKVVESGVYRTRDDETGTKSFSAKLLYEYEFKGMKFVHDRVAPLNSLIPSRWNAETVQRKYPRGREVRAFVDPRNSGRAVLEPQSQTRRALGYTLVGAGLCAVAIFT